MCIIRMLIFKGLSSPQRGEATEFTCHSERSPKKRPAAFGSIKISVGNGRLFRLQSADGLQQLTPLRMNWWS